LDFALFVGEVISRVDLDIIGQGHQALRPDHNSQSFDSSFYQKLGYNLSLFRAFDCFLAFLVQELWPKN